MKLSLLIVFMCIANAGLSQTGVKDLSQKIKDIQKQFQEINHSSKQYKVRDTVVYDLSTEGAQITGYYQDKRLKKINCSVCAESGKLTIEYYFVGDLLIFAFYKDETYNKPMYQKGSRVLSTREDRYYFHKGALIKWVKSDGSNVKEGNLVFAGKEEEIEADTRLYLKILGNHN